jgi:AraC-like DNA-binding protein
MSLEEMAKEAGLSVSQFSRRFTQIAGVSPMKFAIGQRILRAQLLLRGTSSNINEISDILGYEDVYFFSRQFKQVTNMTPSAYRQQGVF